MRRSFGTFDANLWRWQFLRQLRRQLGRLGLDRGLVRRTAESAQLIFNDHRGDAPDKQGVTVVGLNALLLAAYRELIDAGVQRTVAFDAIRNTFRACFHKPTQLAVRTVMLLSNDPVRLLQRVRLSRVFGRIFGKMFTFEDRYSEQGVELRITKCGSNEFFIRHGEPLLTLIFCEWDQNWLGPIQSSRHAIKVDRPVTMATGAGHCEFHIGRSMEAKIVRDVTIQRRTEAMNALREEDHPD
ncbi:L-2-amino-thiazoline-4-carboxylic acid hydrolase [Sphingopyxis sp. Root214]|uniref:L-2-amino-thiazoline-4-carboxylic acid hydrolase n=2 Tax=unclassified Sphingopyxis TaxID=2614943 RepID=UPI0009EA984A|nr:L-2-amino-thiazoline-4-carboxylic acid hydrolase [Sphingopyxis sp. Root214]